MATVTTLPVYTTTTEASVGGYDVCMRNVSLTTNVAPQSVGLSTRCIATYHHAGAGSL